MSILEHFGRLFAYDKWANGEVITSLKAAPDAPARCVQLLAHILSAERLWMERVQQVRQTYPVWPDITLAKCEIEAAELSALWQAQLAGLTSAALSGEIRYVNSKGEGWTNRLEDILTHVVMHSAYHRGQIATQMRTAGYVPAYTDFIHGVRQGLVE